MDRYMNDREFRFTVYEDKVHVMNFKQILVLEDYYISFQSYSSTISIHGEHLVLSKLLENEMLIKGVISKVEVHHD